MKPDTATDLPLFDGVPIPMPIAQPDPLEHRYEVMRAAEAAANAKWREAYEEFILRYLTQHADGTAEDIRNAYNANPRNPRTKSEQASGGIFARLKRKDLIRDIGWRQSRKFGNNLTIWKRVFELED